MTTTATKERPILFSGPMVRAIIDGRKTQTRRPIKPQPDQDIDDLHGGDFRRRAPYSMECNETGRSTGFGFEDDHGHRWQCPFGPPGALLWVRETWAIHCCAEKRKYAPGEKHPWGSPIYKATHMGIDPKCEGFAPWRPSIHMPRWASRITLRVKRVWVERVQDISEESAQAEGVDPSGPVGNISVALKMKPYRYQFANLWESVYPESWDANEWVWACEFERVKP